MNARSHWALFYVAWSSLSLLFRRVRVNLSGSSKSRIHILHSSGPLIPRYEHHVCDDHRKKTWYSTVELEDVMQTRGPPPHQLVPLAARQGWRIFHTATDNACCLGFSHKIDTGWLKTSVSVFRTSRATHTSLALSNQFTPAFLTDGARSEISPRVGQCVGARTAQAANNGWLTKRSSSRWMSKITYHEFCFVQIPSPCSFHQLQPWDFHSHSFGHALCFSLSWAQRNLSILLRALRPQKALLEWTCGTRECPMGYASQILK